MTRNKLFEDMRVERTRLMEVVGELPADLANCPRSLGEWSIKDLIAHMVAWEEEALHRLELIKADREQEIRYIAFGEADDWNARAVAAKQGLSWQQTLSSFMEVRERLLEAMEGVGEERLMAKVGPVPIYRWLSNLTYSHEREHLPEMVAWLREKS